ncbi:hypothetical protein ACFQX6_07355 [Streptosporangium lutulentum]
MGLDESELIAALRRYWAVEASSAEYLPVGAGSYHWSVSDRNGAAWFVTADDLGADEATREEIFGLLGRSLESALSLRRDAGLDFLVTPIPATDGAVLRRLTPRYGLSVFPMVCGTCGDFGPHRHEDVTEMVGLLAELHRATPVVERLAPRADLRLPGRDRLHEALRDVDRPWTGGPHAEPARGLLVPRRTCPAMARRSRQAHRRRRRHGDGVGGHPR